MLEFLNSALGLLFPEFCAGCGEKGRTFCDTCKTKIDFVDPNYSCPLCGRFLGHGVVCGECIESKRNYSNGFFIYYYTEPLRNAIHEFKFEKRKKVGRMMVRMAEKRISELRGRFDYLLPVPITEKRLKERGFNQAYILAMEISRITKIPVLPNVLIKIRDTKDQYTLDKDERKRNIKGAFAIKGKNSLVKKRTLIVDDLFTTGYTLMEAARVVANQKPESVSVFALARAL
ncbi:MAG: ComF family protein [Deltaproteobacteria bacterium]|nr:ComF family protein [Deltaproteobacteria bacterium]